MAIFDQLGRFLEQGTATLVDVRAALEDARKTLAALQPTVEALPSLVEEIRALIARTDDFVASQAKSDDAE